MSINIVPTADVSRIAPAAALREAEQLTVRGRPAQYVVPEQNGRDGAGESTLQPGGFQIRILIVDLGDGRSFAVSFRAVDGGTLPSREDLIRIAESVEMGQADLSWRRGR